MSERGGRRAHTVDDTVTRLRAAGCVFAEDEARLLCAAARSRAELHALVRRRSAGLPLEQLIGWVEFGGHRVLVDEHVFVPRRRTELLARHAAQLSRVSATSASAPPAVVELCCGSGAVSVLIRAAHAGVELHLVEVDQAAVACARRNIGPPAVVYRGDLYEPLPPRLRGRCAVVVANPPYVPTDAIALLPAEARIHEPHGALDGGADGLTVVRRIIRQAPAWLRPGGSVLVESSSDQAPQVAATVTAAGMLAEIRRSAVLDATVVIGRKLD